MRRLALLNCFFVLSLVFTSLVLNVLSLLEGSSILVLGPQLFIGPSIAFLPILAYLIITRRPENIIGPGFSVVASMAALSGVVEAYIHYGLDVAPGSLPGIEVAAWLSEWAFVPAVLPLLTFLFLLCPDGRLPSPRWRPVALFIAGNLAILTLALIVAPFESRPELDNPFRVTVLGDVPQIAVYVGYIGLIPSIGLSALAMVLRFRRSTGIERLQLKWFASASVAALGLFVLSWIISSFTSSDAVWSYCLLGAVMLVVLATATAVLRYHLYDIDRIISRTLTYGLLTAALGATYLGLVVGLQALLRPVSGGSDLAIVVTTLTVAALFLPARRRIQDAVDRCFNRRTYDAVRTIETFNARLREQIDLDTLRYELLSVVDETMQPVKASLWLLSREVRQ
ncbi:MAG: hypothetical protein ACRDJE_07045 [Dehalococcoidia bacterium]